MQEEAREEVWWLSALGPPPSLHTAAACLGSQFLEVVSASRSEAEG